MWTKRVVRHFGQRCFGTVNNRDFNLQAIPFVCRECLEPSARTFRGPSSIRWSSSTSFQPQFEQDSSDSPKDQTSDDSDVELIRQEIADKAVSLVSSFGWSREALAAAAEACGLPSVAHGLFPKGGVDLVISVYERNNEEFAKSFAPFDKNLHGSPKEFIKSALMARLRLNEPYLNSWASALSLLAQPGNCAESVRLLGQFVDDVWYFAGDTRVDSSWYGKRAALGSVYHVTEIFMLNDKSENFSATRDFLNQRVDEFWKIQKCMEVVEKPIGNSLPFLRAASITMANILGLNQRRHF